MEDSLARRSEAGAKGLPALGQFAVGSDAENHFKVVKHITQTLGMGGDSSADHIQNRSQVSVICNLGRQLPSTM